MSAPYSLRETVRAEVVAHHAALVEAAAQRSALRAEVRATQAAADWTNLLEMLAQPGRPVPAAQVRRFAKAAKASKADLAAALSSAQVSL